MAVHYTRIQRVSLIRAGVPRKDLNARRNRAPAADSK